MSIFHLGWGLLLAWGLFTVFVVSYATIIRRDMADPDGRARRGRDMGKAEDVRAYQAHRDRIRRGRDSLDHIKQLGLWPVLLGGWALVETLWLSFALYLIAMQ